MPRHTATEIEPVAPQVVEDAVAAIATAIDLRTVRSFDGYVFVDFIEADKIGARVLHAHDDRTLYTLGIEITVS